MSRALTDTIRNPICNHAEGTAAPRVGFKEQMAGVIPEAIDGTIVPLLTRNYYPLTLKSVALECAAGGSCIGTMFVNDVQVEFPEETNNEFAIAVGDPQAEDSGVYACDQLIDTGKTLSLVISDVTGTIENLAFSLGFERA